MFNKSGGVCRVRVSEEDSGGGEGSGGLPGTVAARPRGCQAVGRTSHAHRLRAAGVGVVYVTVADLAVELLGAYVGFD